MSDTIDYRKIYEEISAKYPYTSRRELPPRAKALAEGLKDCRDADLLQELGRIERDHLLERMSTKSLGTALSSAGYYREFGNIPLEQGVNAVAVPKRDKDNQVVGTRLKHAFVESCGLTDEEWRERNKSTIKLDRLENPVEIDPSDVLDRAHRLLCSESDWREIAAGLILSTGRRPHEIMLTAHFDRLEDDDYHVGFSGQGKKRGDEPEFAIATLLPAKDVISALNRLRKDEYVKTVISEVKKEFPLRGNAQQKREAKVRRNERIDSRTNKSLLRIVQSEFASVVPARYEESDRNNKALRAVYLAMAVNRDCDRRATPGEEMLQAARYAGHYVQSEKPESDSELRNLVTTLGYMDFRLKKDVPFWKPEPRKRMGAMLYESDENRISEWCEKWELDAADTVRRLLDLAEKAMEAPPIPQTSETDEHQTEEKTEMPSEIENRVSNLETQISDLVSMVQSLVGGDRAPSVPAGSGDVEAESVESEPKTVEPSKSKPKPWSRQWDVVHKDELFGLGVFDKPARGTGAADERVIRSIVAIETFNREQVDPGERWQISNLSIRELAGCNGNVVKRVLKERPGLKERIDRHNEEMEIAGDFHNRENHAGEDIRSQVFGYIPANRN